MVLSDLQLKENDPDDYDPWFGGLWYGARKGLMTWRDWHQHGNYPHPGGSLDQPPLWHRDKDVITNLYNYFLAVHKDDKRDATE